MAAPACLSAVPISPRQRLDDVLKRISGLPFGRTDCALPMLWATANKAEVDTFVIYTDNESGPGTSTRTRPCASTAIGQESMHGSSLSA